MDYYQLYFVIPLFLALTSGFISLHSPKPLLYKIPMIGTSLYFALDAALAPLMTYIFALPTSDPTVLFGGYAGSHEYPAAIAALVLHYGLISLSFGAGWRFFKRRARPDIAPSPDIRILRRLWSGSAVVALLGLCVNLSVLFILLRTNTLVGLAAERALFSDETAVANPLFNYLFLMLPFLDFGIWGMLLFRAGSPNKSLWIPAAAFSIGFNIICGGRSRTVLAILVLLLIYHAGIKRISIKHLATTGFCLAGGLCAISAFRFGAQDLLTGFLHTARVLFFDRRFEQVAFALRAFPGDRPFLDGESLLPSLAFLVPGLKLPGVNMYMLMMTEALGPTFSERGYGGGNYAAAAEHFANFGWSGVALVALAFGFFHGFVFSYCHSNRQTPLPLLVFASLLPSFIGGSSSRTVVAWSSSIPGLIFPLAVLLMISFSRQQQVKRLVLVSLLAVCAFVASRGGSGLLKAAMLFFISATYLQTIVVLNAVSRLCTRRYLPPHYVRPHASETIAAGTTTS